MTLLLAAYFLNLFRYIPQGGRPYILLHIIGAGLVYTGLRPADLRSARRKKKVPVE